MSLSANPIRPPTPTQTFFFYGTLMAPSVLSRVTHTPASIFAHTTHPAILLHHRRHRVKHCDYPAVIPSTSSLSDASSSTMLGSDSLSSSVRGTVVTGITEGQARRLDIFEGGEYERRKVRVRVFPETHDRHTQTGDGEREQQQEEEEKEEEEEEEEEGIEAYTYIWTSSPSFLEDAEWDFEEFAREKMHRWDDSGFQDVEDAEKKDMNVVDPTGGRHYNGSFEKAMGVGK